MLLVASREGASIRVAVSTAGDPACSDTIKSAWIDSIARRGSDAVRRMREAAPIEIKFCDIEDDAYLAWFM